MEQADLLRWPLAVRRLHGAKEPRVYWDPLGLVATSAAMMVIFLCAAVSFLGYKVCVLDSDEHDEIETELADRRGQSLPVV